GDRRQGRRSGELLRRPHHGGRDLGGVGLLFSQVRRGRFPKSDVAATAIASRALDCGSARGYGALETLTATELMMDEIAGELGLDVLEFRLRNGVKTGMRNGQGAVPHGMRVAGGVVEEATDRARRDD